jgi:hypothetical protein
MDPPEITEARRALGVQLATLREAAGYTQWQFAPLVLHSRSTVANVETGHQPGTRDFWASADRAVNANGALLQGYEQLQALIRRRREDTAAARLAARDVLVGCPHATAADEETEVVQPAVGGRVVDVPWEIVRRRCDAGASNVDEARLGYLEEMTRQAVRANDSKPPVVLAPRVRDLRRHVGELMKGQQHPPQRTRLYAVAAYLSGLLGALALDLGYQRSAAEYGLEAYQLADAVDDRQLRAWARATQSLIAYYAGDYHGALALARDGQRWADGGPQGVRLAVNGEARALARMGDGNGVDEAVDRAFTLLAGASASVRVSPSLAVDMYCLARTAANAATAYVATRTPGKALEYATQALREFDRAGLRGPQALSRLDLATAALMSGKPELERSCVLVKQAMTVAAEHRFESVRQRAQEFLSAASTWAAEPSVREVAELVHAYAVRPALPA